MTDDVATKLEFLLQEGAEIIKEQAAEIERLKNDLNKQRYILERWRYIAKSFYDNRYSNDQTQEQFAAHAYEEALRSE